MSNHTNGIHLICFSQGIINYRNLLNIVVIWLSTEKLHFRCVINYPVDDWWRKCREQKLFFQLINFIKQIIIKYNLFHVHLYWILSLFFDKYAYYIIYVHGPCLLTTIFSGGLICRGILSTTQHNVDTFIALSSPLAGQYGGEF